MPNGRMTIGELREIIEGEPDNAPVAICFWNTVDSVKFNGKTFVMGGGVYGVISSDIPEGSYLALNVLETDEQPETNGGLRKIRELEHKL
jgi:hypothetical protein